MKKLLYICLGIVLVFNMSACSDYLDINENPDAPSNTFPTCVQRLRAIQTQFMSPYVGAGFYASHITGNIAYTYGDWNSWNNYFISWQPWMRMSVSIYENWFIYTASNIPDLMAKAEETSSWHYLGAAQLIHAWGFMLMVDVLGEIPYTEALCGKISPKYDDGKTVYYGCMDMLEKAIENFKKTQTESAERFSDGDIWNNGDADKWLKLAHGLKARWMLNTSKKNSFDPQKVLDVLDNAAKSNADNTIMGAINSPINQEIGLRASLHAWGTNTSGRAHKFFMDLLTNTFTGGTGVIDPRTDLLVPSGQFRNDKGQLEYRRTVGVDIFGETRLNGGPINFDVFAPTSSTAINFYDRTGRPIVAGQDVWASSTTNPQRYGDSIYVPIYSDHLSWVTNGPGALDDDRYLAYRYNGKEPIVISTGTFYTRADAPNHLMCYPEVSFMRAECYYRLGKKSEAVAEYKKGIRAHMELMNEKLKEYDQNIFGKQVIPAEKMDEYLASEAVAQNAGEITMTKIMQQKFIACSYSIQNWNDMRRFNYSAGNIEDFGVVYPDHGRPGDYIESYCSQFFPESDPKNDRYWWRRLDQCDIEQNYNEENYKASNPEAGKPTVYSLPVWWDTTEE